MPLHKKNKKPFFKNYPVRLKKLVVAFIVFAFFMIGLEWLLHHTPTQLFRMKEITVEDIDFSDIHYQVKKAETATKQVVLVNISSWPPDSIRYKLVSLIDRINVYNPKAIGVDIYFEPKPDKEAFEAVNEQLDSLFQKHKIVIGVSYASKSEFPLGPLKTVHLGSINMPGDYNATLRTYFYDRSVKYLPGIQSVPSFACKLYEVFSGNKISRLACGDSTFTIRYNTGTELGFYNALTVSNPQVLQDTVQDFAAFEADDVTAAFPKDNLEIGSLFKDKCVIIGVLGKPDLDYKNDLTDKHRVPVNFDLFNRMPTMPGAVVHANVVQMFINEQNGEKKLHTIEGWRYNLIAGGIIFLYLLVFALLEKIRPFLIKLVLEILFLVISILSLIRLSAGLMNCGYHINVGRILLYIAFLIEYKMFASELHEYLEKQDLRKRFTGWYSGVKYFFGKDALSKKIRKQQLEMDVEINSVTNKTGNDEG